MDDGEISLKLNVLVCYQKEIIEEIALIVNSNCEKLFKNIDERKEHVLQKIENKIDRLKYVITILYFIHNSNDEKVFKVIHRLDEMYTLKIMKRDGFDIAIRQKEITNCIFDHLLRRYNIMLQIDELEQLIF
jgi:hypothetical protein